MCNSCWLPPATHLFGSARFSRLWSVVDPARLFALQASHGVCLRLSCSCVCVILDGYIVHPCLLSKLLTAVPLLVSIVDDGCQWTHPELRTQYLPHLSRNLNPTSGSLNAEDPSPDLTNGDFHGTACSGVATGHNNSVCGVGSAYEAR
jgi:hypothetical protein